MLNFVTSLLFLLLFLSSTSSAHSDQRYVAYLRERGMYRLAELYCREQLASGKLDPRTEVEMAIELSLVAVSQAYDAPQGERARHWQRAHEAIAPWLAAQQPFSLLAELQEGLNLLAEAELAHLELMSRSDPSATQEIQGRVRTAIATLRTVADQVEIIRRQVAMGQIRENAALDEFTLVSLERSVALELARAYRLQGLSYPASSADRVNALQQAVESLTTLSSAKPTDALTWRARVTLGEALAELNETEQGLHLITKWSAEEPPRDRAAELLAVGAKLLAKAGRAEEARGRLTAVPPGTSSAVDLASLELMLQASAEDSQDIEPLLAAIRSRYAPRYIRHAEAMVGERFAAAGDVTSPAGKVHAAEHFYRAGQFAPAVAAYDEAAEMFRNQQDRDRAFAAERSAAAVMQKSGSYQEAAERFRRLALASIDREESALDHREAVLCFAMLARESSGDASAKALASYLELCREHLSHWPTSSTTDEVRWWLAQALAARRQWQATLAVLSEVAPATPHYEEATALLATAYREQLAATTDTVEREKLAREARAKLQPAIVGSGDSIGWPREWSDAQRTCALELAHILLDASNAEDAEKFLSASLIGSPPASDDYKGRATPVLAMSLVSGGKTAEAIAILKSTVRGEGANSSLEPLAERLAMQLAEYSTAQASRRTERAAVGQLLLEVLGVAGGSTSTWKLPADRYRAAALAAVDNTEEARTLYQLLAKQFPKNGDIQEEYAAMLAASTSAADREAALNAYAVIETATHRGSDRWHRARKARIELLVALGRQDEADKLKKLTQLLSGKK